MRLWQFWWQTMILSSQQHPPRFIEGLMSMFAVALLMIWVIRQDWPYLVLGGTYAVGTAASIWVGEVIAPSTQFRLTLATMLFILTVLLLLISLYGFTGIVHS